LYIVISCYGDFQELISEGITLAACKSLHFCSETWDANDRYELHNVLIAVI